MKTIHLATIIIIFGTTILFAFSISNRIDINENQLSKEQCMGGNECPGAPQMPSASVGNRTIEIAIKLYSSNTTPTGIHDIWFRFFDANTNQTIHHVSFFFTITKEGKVLFRELLHTHTGILNAKVSHATGTTWSVEGDHEPILNGWVPYNGSDSIVMHVPLFNETGSTYHLSVQMFSIDRDNNIFDNTDNPYSVPNFALTFDTNVQNRTIVLKSFPPLPISVGYFQLVTNSYPVDGYLWLGPTLFVQTDAENISPQWQNFTYITEVFDDKGRVEGIQWHNMQLDPMKSATLSNRWTPSKAGNYTVDEFVWANFTGHPVPVADSLKTSVEVRK